MSTLDSFLTSPQQKVYTSLATSQEIRDRGSTFVANIYPATTIKETRAAVSHIKHIVHGSKPASHEVSAWRCMVLKAGKTGLGGPDDFELKTGSDDDGEQYAGGKVLKVMQDEGVIDAVVVVSRWYGGIMLGPIRFTHFEICTREVCRSFRLKDDMTTALTTLTSLDDILASLRADLAVSAKSSDAPGSIGQPQPMKAQDYTALEESLDIAKARRLITARENSIKSVKAALRKRQETQKGQN